MGYLLLQEERTLLVLLLFFLAIAALSRAVKSITVQGKRGRALSGRTSGIGSTFPFSSVNLRK